jgi:hypothetical protein
MMLAEAMQYLVGLAERAASPVEIGAGRVGVRDFVYNGKMHTIVADPMRVQHRVARIEDLRSFLDRFGVVHEGRECHVWVTPKSIEAFVHDDADAHTYGAQRAAIARVLTAQATALAGLRSGVSFDQRELVKFLRFSIPTAPREILAAVRAVDFSRKSAGASSIEHGRESLGRSVELKVQGAAEIPESFAVAFMLYEGVEFAGTWGSIDVHVLIDLESSKFTLFVRPDEWQRRLDSAELEIAARVKSEIPNARVFIGTPTLT